MGAEIRWGWKWGWTWMWCGEVARKLSADSDGGGFQPAPVYSRVHLDEAHRLPHCRQAELCSAEVSH